jgi:hypothetical protein
VPSRSIRRGEAPRMPRFFSRGRGQDRSRKSSTSGRISLLQQAKQSGFQIATKKCSKCGAAFPSSRETMLIGIPPKGSPLSSQFYTLQDHVLDMGGYCPNCRMYRCPDHAKFVVSGESTGEPFSLTHWVLGCSACGSPLIWRR